MFVTTPALAARVAELAKDEKINIIIKSRRLDKAFIQFCLSDSENLLRHEIGLGNFISLKVPVKNLEHFEKDPAVIRIEEDRQVYAVLDTSATLVGASASWAAGLKGTGVKIAVVDTGLDVEHPDISRNIQAVKDFTLQGFKDPNGHGTHVAAIAAGTGAASAGKFTGIAPGATLLGAKALKADGSGRMSDVMAAVEWSVNYGAQVINLSLGTAGPADGVDALSEICDLAVRTGVVLVTAAGNDGPERATIGIPASSREVITVGACSDDLVVTDFSGRGPTVDGRVKPDVVAPAVDIVSALASGVDMGLPVDEHYTSATGSSLGAAHVSGLAALLLEARPDASPHLVKEALMVTAKDLGFAEIIQGRGLVQAAPAIEYVRTHKEAVEIGMHAAPPQGCLTTLINMPRLGIRQLFRS